MKTAKPLPLQKRIRQAVENYVAAGELCSHEHTFLGFAKRDGRTVLPKFSDHARNVAYLELRAKEADDIFAAAREALIGVIEDANPGYYTGNPHRKGQPCERSVRHGNITFAVVIHEGVSTLVQIDHDMEVDTGLPWSRRWWEPIWNRSLAGQTQSTV